MQNSFSMVAFWDYRHQNKKSAARKRHSLRMENLEERALLSISPLNPVSDANDSPTIVSGKSAELLNSTLDLQTLQSSILDAQGNTNSVTNANSVTDANLVAAQISPNLLPAGASTTVPTTPIIHEINSLTGTYYTLEYSLGGGKGAFVAGLSQTDIQRVRNSISGTSTKTQNVNGDFIDAQKYGYSVSNMCWAGAVSNALWYTGWANEQLTSELGAQLFTSEDSVLRLYGNNFTNSGCETFYSGEWFIDGKFRPQTWESWTSTVLRDGSTGGGYYADSHQLSYASDPTRFTANGQTIEAQYEITGSGFKNLDILKQNLEDGNGATFHIKWENGGHLITAWGFVYDTNYSPTEPEYYSAVFITDPDDGAYNGTNAPDIMKCVPIVWNGSAYIMQDYGYGAGKNSSYILNFTTLAQYESSMDLEMVSGGTLSVTNAAENQSVFLNNVRIKNVGNENSRVFSVDVYASLDGTFSENDILLTTVDNFNLDANESTSFSTQFNTSKLTNGTTYTIFTVAKSALDSNNTNNVIACAQPLQMEAAELSAPSVIRTNVQKTSISYRLRGVANAISYQLEYSTDSTFSDASKTVTQWYETDGTYTISGLEGGTTYYFRCKAIGDGTYFKDSRFSAATSIATQDFVYDLKTNSNVAISEYSISTGADFTLRDLEITNVGDTFSGKYTVSFYASSNRSISASDQLLKTVEMASLPAGESVLFDQQISSMSLAVNKAIYIGWIVSSEKDVVLTNNVGVSVKPIRITQAPLEIPTLTATPGDGSLNVEIGEVANAESYVVQYSVYKNFAEYDSQRFTQSGSQPLTGLLPYTTYYLRVYAVGSGAWLNSGLSEIIEASTDSTEFTPYVTADGSSIQTQWNKISGTTSYYVYWRKAGTDDWSEKVVYDTQCTLPAVAGWDYEVQVSDYARTAFSDIQSVTLLEKPCWGNVQTTSSTISAEVTNLSLTNLEEANQLTITLNSIGGVAANYTASMSLTNGSGVVSFSGTNITATYTDGKLTLSGLKSTVSHSFHTFFGITNTDGQQITRSAVSTSLKAITKAEEAAETSGGIVVQDVDVKTMTITWDPILLPGNEYVPQFYTVKYRKVDTMRWSTSTTRATMDGAWTLKNLTSGTGYEVQVYATPVRGKTVSTEVRSVMATTNVQLLTPRLTRNSISDSSFRVEVTNFDSTNLNQSTHVTVTLTQIGAQSVNLSTTFALSDGQGTFAGTGISCQATENDGLFLNFTGTSANTTYGVKVSFSTISENVTTASSNASSVLRVSTVKAVYATPEVTTETISANQILVQWNEVKGAGSNSNAYSYSVQYRVADSNAAWTTAASAVTGTEWTISKLKADTEYEIRVFANRSVKFMQSDYALSRAVTWTQLTAPKATIVSQGRSALIRTNLNSANVDVSSLLFGLTINGKSVSTENETSVFTEKLEWTGSSPLDFGYGTLALNLDGSIRVTLAGDYISTTLRISFTSISGQLRNGANASWSGNVNSVYFVLR